MATALENGFGPELFADVDLRRLAVICLEAHEADPGNDEDRFFIEALDAPPEQQFKRPGAPPPPRFRSSLAIDGDAEQASEIYSGGPGWGGIDNLRPQFSKFHVEALRDAHKAEGGGRSFPPVADYAEAAVKCRGEKFPARCGGDFARLFAGRGFPEWQAREMLEVDFLDGQDEAFKAEAWKCARRYARLLANAGGKVL